MSHDAGLGGRLGVRPVAGGLRLPLTDAHRREGVVATSVLLWLADWEGCRAAVDGEPGKILATRDLRVRRRRPSAADTLVARGVVVRRGRTTTIEIEIVDAQGPVAHAIGSYASMAWGGPPESNPQIQMSDPAVLERRPPLHAPLPQLLGTTRHGPPGALRLEHRGELENPQGGLSGPIVALLAEEAALDRLERPVADLAVYFLAAGRVGPFVTMAREIDDGMVRVAIDDEGSGTRLAVCWAGAELHPVRG